MTILRGCLLAALVACSGTQGERPFEDCFRAGDEDGNGVADCDDPLCRGLPMCAVCGDGRREGNEECDDGNLVDGDGCDHNCRPTGRGNGVVTAGEGCDDGNLVDGDGCDHNCLPTGCGNGVVTAGEGCDDGNLVDGDGCDHNCLPTGCGNGVVTAGEDCDDGNLVDGDGCDNCRLTRCGNDVVTRGEDCDDGNTTDGDGCDATCHFGACPGEVAVAPGGGGSFAVAGQIAKLIADPVSCFVYAIDTASPSHLVVISTATKRVLTEVTLLEDATDIAISPSGSYLVISYATSAIGIVDTATWQSATRVPTFASPSAVAVKDNGIAFYVDSSRIVRRIDLRDATGDTSGLTGGGDLSLARDGHTLYIGDWGTSSGDVRKYDITGGTAVLLDEGNDAGEGFYFPPRHVYVSSGGQHLYYANYQLDSASLAAIRGSTGELIFTEDVAGTFAVGEHHVFDAELVRPVATLPHAASAAVLTAGDHELWYYSPDTGRIYFVNADELIGGVALGVRDIDPAPLDTFRFAELRHDPVRPRLYGIDSEQQALVVIDDTTLQPTHEILVGSTPLDIDIDAGGTTLFVAHQDTMAFARIRLDTLGFDRFVHTSIFPARLAAAGAGRLVMLGRAQFNRATLTDAVTGQVMSQGDLVPGGSVATTADGGTVFVGQSNTSSGTMYRYSLATGSVVETNRSTAVLAGPQLPVVPVPDGSGVFYTGHLLNGHDLSVVPYSFDGPILAVSPDGRRALSARSVYDVATGTRLGALPVVATAVAISPDGAKAFLSSGGTLRAMDLTAF
ncbi:MAG TPA: DUF4215 domain-containing protein [Kofleriaceae bacterium]